MLLAGIVAISAMPYLTGLGFYSDDWILLTGFTDAWAQGWRAALDAATGGAARPGHGLYAALLIGLFGFEPLGYHIINTIVLAAAIAALHRLSLRLGVNQFHAFAICLVLVVLPQLSTVRIWFSTAQIPLGMLFCMASFHAQLNVFEARSKLWGLVAVLAAIASLACYEIFAPLLVAFPVALAAEHYLRRDGRGRISARRLPAIFAAIATVAALAVLLKANVSDRVGAPGLERYLAGAYQFVRLDYDWRVDSSLNIYAAASVHFWHSVKGWYSGASALATGELNAAIVCAAFGVGALAYWRLQVAPLPDRSWPYLLRLVLYGIAIFILGHATFLIVPSIMFAPTGMANRTLVAAAIGAAILFGSALAIAARRLPTGTSQRVLAALFAIIAFAGTARIGQIGAHWTAASHRQEEILALARRDLASLPSGATVILDGVCPYHGPGVVFETDWDVGPALSHALARPVRGDVVSDRMHITAGGLRTSIYGIRHFYPFGEGLVVYDPGRRLLTRLPDEVAAQNYFRQPARRARRCAAGYVGHGQLI